MTSNLLCISLWSSIIPNIKNLISFAGVGKLHSTGANEQIYKTTVNDNALELINSLENFDKVELFESCNLSTTVWWC